MDDEGDEEDLDAEAAGEEREGKSEEATAKSSAPAAAVKDPKGATALEEAEAAIVGEDEEE